MINSATNTPASDLPGKGIKPLVSLLAHPRLALAVFLAVLLAGIPVVFIKGKTYYSATATVQVAPTYMKTIRDDGELSFPSNTQYREFLEQQTKSVLRYDIVRDALRGMGDKASVWRQPNESERSSVDRLRAQLSSRSIPDTYMIEISLQGARQDGMADVVNAVVNTYIERMRDERIYGADVRVKNLQLRETQLVGTIQNKAGKRSALALQLGISAFTGKEENPYDRVQADMRTTLAEARNVRFDAEARLKAFETNGETDISTRSIQEAVLIDPGLANLKSNLYKRRADLLTQMAGLTQGHPGYRALSDELRQIDAEIAAQTGTLSSQVRSSLKSRYKTTVDQSRQIEADLLAEFNAQRKLGAEYANLYNQAMTLTLDIDQDRKELETVRERLNQLAAERNSFGFVRLLTPALPPETPYGPGKKKILLMVLMAALLAGLAAPTAWDLLDTRVHTVNDAERILGVPALGWMVEQSDSAARLFGEDQLRRMAGSLIHERTTQGTGTFAFSSVKPGAGASHLTLELARTLTALGYPALVVEANAFLPDARMRSGAGSRAGLVECLSENATIGDCIIPATETMPDRIWLGDTRGARHIDRLDRLNGLCAEINGNHPFVLLDIPPLLLSADAEIIARSVRHMIVVVEADGLTKGELSRAGREIEKLAPSALGLVVNRVKTFVGGGYLRDLQVEYLTGRKAEGYFSPSSLMLQARIQLSQLPLWLARIKSFLKRTR